MKLKLCLCFSRWWSNRVLARKRKVLCHARTTKDSHIWFQRHLEEASETRAGSVWKRLYLSYAGSRKGTFYLWNHRFLISRKIICGNNKWNGSYFGNLQGLGFLGNYFLFASKYFLSGHEKLNIFVFFKLSFGMFYDKAKCATNQPKQSVSYFRRL